MALGEAAPHGSIVKHSADRLPCSATAIAGTVAAASYLDGKYQLRRDLTYAWHLRRAAHAYERRVREDTLSPWYDLETACKKYPRNRAIWTRERSWTFAELHDQVVRYAQWLIEQGIRPGDLVALYLHNSAEFVMLMFAALAIGAGPAMINYNLEGKALMHCLSVCETKLIIVDPDPACRQRIEGSRADMEASCTQIVTLDVGLKQAVSARPVVVPGDERRRGMRPEFPFALIYTSGTTGLPKGCPYTISRMHLAGTSRRPSYQAQPGHDCWYSPMPLYHGTGLISTTTALLGGIGVAIAPRFSVTNFWPDIHDSQSTIFIYVGETARYLLAAPPHPLERSHRLRLCFGNGMRPDVWEKFQTRFAIPTVAEFFNSSEGMFGLSVWARNPYLRACVGHHGLYWRYTLRNTYIPVRFDSDTGDIYRDPVSGFAERVPYEVGGEILVAVPSKEAFGGYWRNAGATNKRFATDVFRKGDLYYRAGDALRREPDGHWYFLDRLGDTFRWKSENVSTAEVALALGEFPGIAEANVYGVQIPGYEGRAGCAALDLSQQHLDFGELLRYSRRRLPRYAVPVFLRIVQRSAHIHNHKQNKVGLRKEGVDPEKTGTEERDGAGDVFLWAPPGAEAYERFDQVAWERLVKGEARI